MEGIARQGWCASRWRRLAAFGALAVTALLMTTGASAAQSAAAMDQDVHTLAERVAAEAWDTFSARVTVRQQWVNDAGVPIGQAGSTGTTGMAGGTAPTALVDEYVWERARTATGWKTRLTVVGASGVTVRTRQGNSVLPDAQVIGWMEDNEDGSAPRFFSRAGVELRPRWRQPEPRGGAPSGREAAVRASASDLAPGIDPGLLDRAMNSGGLRRPPGREWIGSFVVLPGRAATRLQSLTTRFGRRSNWVRGYGQYLRDEGGRRLELLVDEQDGVPVEANVIADGALQSHTTFRYERAMSGALVRKGVRVERPMSPQEPGAVAGARLVTDVVYSQVQLLSKGGR